MAMTALWSDLIPQTFGACFGGGYESVPTIVSFFQQTGLRTARMGRVTPGSTAQRAMVNALYDAGVRTVVAICDEWGSPTLDARIAEVVNNWDPRLVVIFEPVNEPQRNIANPGSWAQSYSTDSDHTYTGQTFGVLEVRRQALDLWQNRPTTADVMIPALATKSITDPPTTPGWYATLGDMTDRSSLGNLHCYAGGRPLPKDGEMAGYLPEIAAKTSGNVPLIVTEMGWHDMMDTTGLHIATPPSAQQVYTARGLFEVAQIGVKRAIFYEAVDDAAAGSSSDATTWYERHFGLSTLNADNTVTLKQQNGAQIAYVMSLYSDTVSSFTPQPLAATVTPGTGSTNDVVTDLRQHSSGRWFLAVWRNESVWNGARYGTSGYPGSPVSVPDTPFVITLPRGMRVKEHRPAQTSTPTALSPDTAGRTATTSSYTRMVGPDANIYEIGPSLIGYVSGSTGSGASATVTVTLPSGIPDGSTLILSSASSAAGTATPSGISGSFTRVPGSGNPDGAGSTMPTYCWSATVNAVDSGATVTVTFSTSTAHNTVIGGVWAAEVTPTGTFSAIAASSGAAPTCTAQGGVTVELAHARIASGTTAVTLPDTSTSSSVGTSAGSGNIGSAIAECTTDGGTGGTISTSPAAAKIAAYTVSMAPAAATVSAAAALTTTSSLTATASGAVTVSAAASLTTTSSLTATATDTVPAAAALTTTSTLTAAGTSTALAAAALTTTSTLTGSATVTARAAASLTTTSTLTAAETTTTLAAAALTTSSSMTAAGTTASPAAASLTTASTLTGSETSTVPAAATLPTTTSLLAAGTNTTMAAASLVTTSALTAAAVRQVNAAASLTTTSTLTASETTTTLAAATLGVTTSTMTASTGAVWNAAASWSTTSSLTAAAQVTARAAAALTTTSTLTAAATDTTPAAAAWSTTSTLTSGALAQTSGAAPLTTTSTLTATPGPFTVPAAAVLTTAAVLTAAATGTVPAPATLTTSSSLTGAATITTTVTAALVTSSSLTAAGTTVVGGVVALTTTSTLTGTGVNPGAATLTTLSVLVAAAAYGPPGSVVITSLVEVQRYVSLQLTVPDTSTTLTGAGMILRKAGQEFYRVRATTIPAAVSGSWSASFDGGQTWKPATVDPTDPTIVRWLVAHPSVTSPDPTASVLPRSVTPQLVLATSVESISRSGPPIHVQL